MRLLGLFMSDSDASVTDRGATTSALDTSTERDIQKALQNLVRGRSSVSIAHRLSVSLFLYLEPRPLTRLAYYRPLPMRICKLLPPGRLH